jgi:hypothetical protein
MAKEVSLSAWRSLPRPLRVIFLCVGRRRKRKGLHTPEASMQDIAYFRIQCAFVPLGKTGSLGRFRDKSRFSRIPTIWSPACLYGLRRD